LTSSLKNTKGYKTINAWLKSKGYKAFAFQEETWQHIIDNKSWLVNAPTGTVKPFRFFRCIDPINQQPFKQLSEKTKNGLHL